jgi:5-(carboxyamino)imidazole ribonucleotide synthase
LHKHLTLGILGGGQLARMSSQAASHLGIGTAILDREKHSPAGQLTPHEFTGWVDNEQLLREFSHHCDAVTLENEFIDYRRLEFIESLGRPVLPSPGVIALIQDKFIQKQTLGRHGIPIAMFLPVTPEASWKELSAQLGTPAVIKSRKMGYDGYGNAVVRSAASFDAAREKLSARHAQLMAEAFIDFTMELAVMVVRTKKETRAYPVVQTVQKNGICSMVIAPAPVDKKIAKRASQIAIAAVEAVGGIGLFGVELFLTSDGKIVVNEMAPRPHNSGHYTIEGCVTSQFENHVRAVFGFPLGSTEMTAPFAVMVNLLGAKHPRPGTANHIIALKNDHAHFHLYGKAASRPGRKMGHVTLLGASLRGVLAEAESLQKGIHL